MELREPAQGPPSAPAGERTSTRFMAGWVGPEPENLPAAEPSGSFTSSSEQESARAGKPAMLRGDGGCWALPSVRQRSQSQGRTCDCSWEGAGTRAEGQAVTELARVPRRQRGRAAGAAPVQGRDWPPAAQSGPVPPQRGCRGPRGAGVPPAGGPCTAAVPWRCGSVRALSRKQVRGTSSPEPTSGQTGVRRPGFSRAR